jgi:hypothetical protein
MDLRPTEGDENDPLDAVILSEAYFSGVEGPAFRVSRSKIFERAQSKVPKTRRKVEDFNPIRVPHPFHSLIVKWMGNLDPRPAQRTSLERARLQSRQQ